jgi:DNA-binding LytR/AlgR family response regulator
MKCIIVDDEPLAREELQALINEVSDIEVCGKFSGAKSALDFLRLNAVDLVFLDIEMPMINGIELALQLSGTTLIIFTTAYSQFAFKSYELDAIDYLLKPVDKIRLEKGIRKAEAYQILLSGSPENNTIEGSTGQFLLIKSERRFHKVKYEDIRFVEGLKDYVVIHLAQTKLITAMNLKNFHQKIPQEVFLRISKSYIVNKNFIESFDQHSVYLREIELPIGEVYKDDFMKAFISGVNSFWS